MNNPISGFFNNFVSAFGYKDRSQSVISALLGEKEENDDFFDKFDIDYYANQPINIIGMQELQRQKQASQSNNEQPNQNNQSNEQLTNITQTIPSTTGTQTTPGQIDSAANSPYPNNGTPLVNSAKQFYQAAVKDGYTYQRTDPTNTKGMDCCTGPWNFLAKYLTKEDFARLEPYKSYAYADAGTLAERTAGFSGAIEKAKLGTSRKVDTAYINLLKGKTSEQINQELTGKIFTYSGTNDKTGKGEGHVAIISKAWKDEKGNIKFEILGPHYFNKKVQEGNNSGIGTSKKIEDLSEFLKSNKTLTLATINDEVIQRAEKANDPKSRNRSASSVGEIAYLEMTKQIANA
jgi:hypothetical protein